MTGCFERLVCDISADPSTFDQDEWMLEFTAWGLDTVTDPKAQTVLAALDKAINFGETASDIATCERRYDQCGETGMQIHQQIPHPYDYE